MSEVKEYISNITIPDGTTKYVKDTELTETVNKLTGTVNTLSTNVSSNAEQIKTNQSNILTNTTKIGENTSDITSLKTKVDEIVDKIYPVGSIYLSMNTVNPSTLFGGNWERIKDRFLLGCGDSYKSIGTYGGEERHTLTVDEIPHHNHAENALVYGYSGWDAYTTKDNGTMTKNTSDGYISSGTTVNIHQVTAFTDTASTGGGGAHNNMPPYVTCYMWQRTA